jgi:hypothetical protein
MKTGHELTAQSDFDVPIINELKRLTRKTDRAAWLTRLGNRLPSRHEFLHTAAVSFAVAALCLAGSYLFLSQLAAHGW